MAQKADDSWHKAKGGGGCVGFPVVDRGLVHADLFRDLALEETEVDSAPAKMVT
jgi:hypothetical protein